MTEWPSLLSLARAPAGTSLGRGIWFTHDLALSALSDHIAPALVNVATTDLAERRRRTAGVSICDGVPPPELVVVADGRRLHHGPAVPWAHIVPVTGRVQHAKFGVLEFVDVTGKPVRRRSFVGSANLTDSGIAENWELLAVEDVAAGSRSRTLAGDLLEAAAKLTAGPGSTGVRASDREHLARLLDDFPRLAGADLVTHSLDTRRPLLSAGDPASRITLVSPPFAADADTKVVTLLKSAGMTEETEVTWYVGAQEPSKPKVPRALWDGLKSGASTTLWPVPEHIGGHRRKLHAKLVAIERAAGIEVTMGSANLTSRGLGGRNRELVVRFSARPSWLAGRIDLLPGEPLHGSPGTTSVVTEQVDESTLALPTISVERVARADDGTLTGQLKVVHAPGTTVEIKVGSKWKDASLDIRIPLQAGTVQVRIRSAKGLKVATVPVDLHDVAPELWLLPGDRDRSASPEEQMVLDVFRRAAANASPKANGGGTPKASGGSDDKYLQNLRQPLVLIARYRAAIIDALKEEEREPLLAQLADLDPTAWHPKTELPIARALLELPPVGSDSSLVQAVRKVIS